MAYDKFYHPIMSTAIIPKLSDLTPDQKIKMLAELDGWKTGNMTCTIPGCKLRHDGFVKEGQFRTERELTFYLTSYDAIIPLVQRHSAEVQSYVWSRFHGQTATPPQLCDAVLVAAGKAVV